jgi:hypothetical protein
LIRNVEFPEIKGVAIAIMPEIDDMNNTDWFVYLVNHSTEPIKNLMVTSRGFGKHNGKKVKTSTLRRFLGDVPAQSSLKIEPIKKELFGLNNEYWVSFYRGKQVYDKKYLFTAGSISVSHLKEVPVLLKKGIWHP